MARTPTTSDVLAAIDDRFPLESAASWDRVGLQIGSLDDPVKRIAVCHDVTDAVIDAAERAGVDLVVAYHPLLFIPTTALVAGRTSSGRTLRLARSGMSLIVVHTAFDVAAGGAADALVEVFSLKDVEPFGDDTPIADTSTAGDVLLIGRRGSLPQPLPLGRFAEIVNDRLGSAPRVAGDLDGAVSRVAVIPGSGRSFIDAASPVDVVVTGDVGHHDARAALDGGVAVVDPGHAATERPGVKKLYSAVAQIAEGHTGVSVVDLGDIDADPWGTT